MMRSERHAVTGSDGTNPYAAAQGGISRYRRHAARFIGQNRLSDVAGMSGPGRNRSVQSVQAAATHLFEGATDLKGIQELLGHATLPPRATYTLISVERLKATYDQAHPRA